MDKKWKAAVLAACLLLAGPAAEAAQYFAPRYNVLESGQIQPPLALKFNTGTSTAVSAQLSATDGDEKILVLGWQEGEKVSLCTFQKGAEYALYKLTLRPGKEDLLVLSYGKKGPGKTQLEGIAVIGEDSMGKIRQLSVSGFVPVEVFNSPLQIRQDEAVLFLDKAPQVLAIQAEGTDGYAVSTE